MGVEQIENFKYESEDVLQMVSKIASDLKQYNKNSRHGSMALNAQKTVTINTEELKQLEIIGTAA